MPENPITPDFYDFFIRLAANNHKEWFDQNRKEYEQAVKIPFESLVQSLLAALGKEDAAYKQIKPTDCIFRINRDIRFSKDKTPYKLNRSAIISTGGRKDMGPAGFYFELGPETCAFYAGSYMPEKPELDRIRHYMAMHIDEWNSVTGNKNFKRDFGSVLGEKSKKAAPGLAEKAAKWPVLLNKQFYVKHEFSPEKSLETDLVKTLLGLKKTAEPMMKFLSLAISVQD